MRPEDAASHAWLLRADGALQSTRVGNDRAARPQSPTRDPSSRKSRDVPRRVHTQVVWAADATHGRRRPRRRGDGAVWRIARDARNRRNDRPWCAEPRVAEGCRRRRSTPSSPSRAGKRLWVSNDAERGDGEHARRERERGRGRGRRRRVRATTSRRTLGGQPGDDRAGTSSAAAPGSDAANPIAKNSDATELVAKYGPSFVGREVLVPLFVAKYWTRLVRRIWYLEAKKRGVFWNFLLLGCCLRPYLRIFVPSPRPYLHSRFAHWSPTAHRAASLVRRSASPLVEERENLSSFLLSELFF